MAASAPAGAPPSAGDFRPHMRGGGSFGDISDATGDIAAVAVASRLSPVAMSPV